MIHPAPLNEQGGGIAADFADQLIKLRHDVDAMANGMQAMKESIASFRVEIDGVAAAQGVAVSAADVVSRSQKSDAGFFARDFFSKSSKSEAVPEGGSKRLEADALAGSTSSTSEAVLEGGSRRLEAERLSEIEDIVRRLVRLEIQTLGARSDSRGSAVRPVKEETTEVNIILDRRLGNNLGATLQCQDGQHLDVAMVEPGGALEPYGVCPGDRIVAVNGLRGDPQSMVNELRANALHNVTLQKPRSALRGAPVAGQNSMPGVGGIPSAMGAPSQRNDSRGTGAHSGQVQQNTTPRSNTSAVDLRKAALLGLAGTSASNEAIAQELRRDPPDNTIEAVAHELRKGIPANTIEAVAQELRRRDDVLRQPGQTKIF